MGDSRVQQFVPLKRVGTTISQKVTGDNFCVDGANSRVGIGTTSPTSVLHSAGSFALPIINKTTGYTATASDHTITCDATSAAFTITLPTAVGIQGRIYVIKKTDATINTVTVDANASETIDGSLTYIIGNQYESIMIQSNNTNWMVI